jgi:hypothetical protein
VLLSDRDIRAQIDLGRVRLDTKGIYTLDFSANGGRIAVGGGADAIALREIVDV